MINKLHNYQHSAIAFALKHLNTYMMIDVGLGKTAIALHAIKQSRLPAIVFAPLRVASVTWPEEIELWTPELSYKVLQGRKKNDLILQDTDITLVSFTSLKWFYNRVEEGRLRYREYFLVVDEASMLKNPTTMRFKMLRNLLPIFTNYKINLSATPNPNGYHELWSQYYILDKGDRLGKTYYSFRSKHFNYTGPPVYKTSLKKGHEKAILNKITDITFRLSGDDYLELPPLLHNKISVKAPANVYNKYKTFEREFVLNLEQEQITAYSASALSMKLRQFIQGALYTSDSYEIVHKLKLKALRELIEAHSGQSVLCALQFKFEYDMISAEFGSNIPIIAGRTKTDSTIRHIKNWNKGSIPLLLCHPLSISHGMNLQTGGHVVIWYGLPWSLEQYKQLNGRLHRQGQKNAVVVNNVVMQSTIDEVIFKVLKKKNASMQELLDTIKNYR